MIKLIIIIVVSVIAGLLILIYIGSRFYKLFRYKNNQQNLQLSELIDNKYFVTPSQQKLSLLGEIKTKNDYIILSVHDFFGDKFDFKKLITENMKTKGISIISYNQRGYDSNQNNKLINLGVYADDVVNNLKAIARKYKKAQVSLLLEGYACVLLPLISKNLRKNKLQLKKIILINPITNVKRLKFGMWAKLKMGFGFLFGFNQKIGIDINYDLLSNDYKFNENLIERNQNRAPMRLLHLLQIKRLNNKFLKTDLHHIGFSCEIHQSKNDLFYSAKISERCFKDVKTYYYEDSMHFNLTIRVDN